MTFTSITKLNRISILAGCYKAHDDYLELQHEADRLNFSLGNHYVNVINKNNGTRKLNSKVVKSKIQDFDVMQHGSIAQTRRSLIASLAGNLN